MKSQNGCPACKSCKVVSFERVSTTSLANVWSKVEQEAGQRLREYLIEKIMPDLIQIDKCYDCGLEFANQMFAADGNWYANIEKYGLRWEFIECLKDLPTYPSKILEVGCGEGYFLELANRKGHKVLGIDFNKTAIEVAKTKSLDVYNCSIKEVRNYTSQNFDAVVFFHVIEHLDNLDSFFEDLAEIMPKGSTLHFSCPGPNRFTTHLESDKKVGLRDVWDYPPLHQTRWNREAADKLLSRMGWQLEKYVEEPFNWRGVSSLLISSELAKKGLKISDLPPFKRKIVISRKMLQTLIPSLRYSGMSMYCCAKR